MSEAEINPAQQFQMGDTVLYVPQGVVTTVTGYAWDASGTHPVVAGYQLLCGIVVPREMLKPYDRYRRSDLEKVQSSGMMTANKARSKTDGKGLCQ